MNKFVDCTIRIMEAQERENIKQDGYHLQKEPEYNRKIIGAGLIFLAWWHRYMEIHGYISPIDYADWLKQNNGHSY